MRPTAWRVGELARRTGLSVRTLHYYDEIGLLSPSRRTEAGHRLYTAADVVRLQQIKSLRHLGFSLEEIRDCLDRPDFPPRRVIEMHLSRLREQIELQQRVRDLLEAIAARLSPAEEVSAEELVQTITEVIGMSERLERYYTREQLEELEGEGARSAKRGYTGPKRSGRSSSSRSAPRWRRIPTRRASGRNSSPGAGWSWSRSLPAATLGSSAR